MTTDIGNANTIVLSYGNHIYQTTMFLCGCAHDYSNDNYSKDIRKENEEE
jgi:hypothetical protein